MSMSMFDDLRVERKLLSAEMKYGAWFPDSYWGTHIGFIGTSGAVNYPKTVNLGSVETRRLTPTGKSIEVLTNFMHEGGDTMEIPVKNPLTAKPLYDTQLLGHEEERKLTYMECHIHIYRKGVIIRDSKMGEQKLKKPEVQRQLMRSAKEDIQDLYQRVFGYQPYLALLERYSDNLTASTSVGGAGLTKKHHPNFYVAGYGKVPYSDTAATYATAVSTGLQTITNHASKKMSAKMIRQMVKTASSLRIQPNIKVGNRKLYSIVISEAAAFDLWQDTEWLAAMKAYEQGKGRENSSELLGAIEGIFYGAVISVDANMPAAHCTGETDYDSTRGTVYYGNDEYLASPIDTGNKKLAILHGASCLTAGYAQPLSFESETWDYKYKKTEGADCMVGFERADVTDYDGKYGTAGNLKENTSSLVWAHYGNDDVTTI